MALVTLAELRTLVAHHKNWEAEGFESADRIVAVELRKGGIGEAEFSAALSQKTITYEGRDVTLVLDFDDKGYLVALELV
jgi:hypothetical protein